MNYWLSFGSTAISGLAPTFIQFRTTAGGTLAPPSISEPGSFGKYMFSYNALTQVCFVADGATSLLAFNDRYITGVLDPSDNFGFTLSGVAASLSVMGGSLSAVGTSLSAFYPYGISGLAQGSINQSLIVQGYSLSVLGYSTTVQNFSLAIQGASFLGTTSSSYGTDSVDPTTVFGFLKRAQETREGNETYTKATGLLDIYSRGSSQLLAEKTISDSTTSTTKT